MFCNNLTNCEFKHKTNHVKGLNDDEVQRQIDHMISFINQEAKEKCEEIEAKAEEEYNIEKGSLVHKKRFLINKEYENKIKKADRLQKIAEANIAHKYRMVILKVQQKCIDDTYDRVVYELSQFRNHREGYFEFMKALLLQALYSLIESKVVVKVCDGDWELIDSIIPEATDIYEETIKAKLIITVDPLPLPKDKIGGLELSANYGKIRVCNTLLDRLNDVYQNILPQIRKALFSFDDHKKFQQ